MYTCIEYFLRIVEDVVLFYHPRRRRHCNSRGEDIVFRPYTRRIFLILFLCFFILFILRRFSHSLSLGTFYPSYILKDTRLFPRHLLELPTKQETSPIYLSMYYMCVLYTYIQYMYLYTLYKVFC